MGDERENPTIYWVDPDVRGVLPLDEFHIPRSLRRKVRRDRFVIRVDTAFRDLVAACAETGPRRPSTWINRTIEALYNDMFDMGYAHSVECWMSGRLVGGLYGVSIGGAFFGESMFSRESGASQVALVHLVARLRVGGYGLLDTQFVTDHLTRFGAIGIPRAEYLQRLSAALKLPGNFYSLAAGSSGACWLELATAEAPAHRGAPASSIHSRTTTS